MCIRDSASTALSAAQFIGQSLSTQVNLDRLQARGQTVMTQQPIDIRTQVWFNPGLVNSYYMVPAMIGIILQYLTTMLTATSIVRERERGTIEQLIVTPLRSWELVVGKLTPYVLIAFLNTIEVLTIGAVSYTHLDGYKRQVVDNGNRRHTEQIDRDAQEDRDQQRITH